MSDSEAQKWVELYHAALLELEHALMAGRLVEARAAIVKRIESLRDMPGLHNEELRSVDQALRNMLVLEREEIRYAVEEQRKAAEEALKQLGKLKPIIERLTSDSD